MKKSILIACLLLGSTAAFAQRDLGYRGFFDISGGLGMTPGSRFMVGASTSHGIQVTPFLYLGVGIAANDVAWKEGYESNYDENDGIIAPVFGDVRLDIWNRGRLSPFIDMRGGYDFICKNGLYLSPSIGAHYSKSDNFGFNISVGYEIQGIDGNFDWDNKERKSLGFLTLKLGIDF